MDARRNNKGSHMGKIVLYIAGITALFMTPIGLAGGNVFTVFQKVKVYK